MEPLEGRGRLYPRTAVLRTIRQIQVAAGLGIPTMLREHGYRGWISLEFEGLEDPAAGVPERLSLLRRHFP